MSVNVEYSVSSVGTVDRTAPVTLPDGRVAYVQGKAVLAQLVPVGNTDHGSIKLLIDDVEGAMKTFGAGGTITATFTKKG